MTTVQSRAANVSPLLLMAAALISVGLVAIASASISLSAVRFGNEWHHAIRHMMYLGAGIVFGCVAYLVPVAAWRNLSPWLLLMALALSVVVLIPGIGRVVNGSQRWIPIAGFTFQPSEFAKFALVLWLSGYMVRHGKELRTVLRGLLKPIAVLVLFAILLLAEPDFGATVIMMGTAFGMLFMGGARLVYVFGLVFTALGGLAGMILMAPYRMKRLMAYQDPWSDPFGSGFQLIQSLMPTDVASGSAWAWVIACRSSSTCQRPTPISYFRSGLKRRDCWAPLRSFCCSRPSWVVLFIWVIDLP